MSSAWWGHAATVTSDAWWRTWKKIHSEATPHWRPSRSVATLGQWSELSDWALKGAG